MAATVPWLLDLRGLQRLGVGSGDATLSLDALASFLANAPAELHAPTGVCLLDAHAGWASTAAAAVLLRWLHDRPRHLCWGGWSANAARDALLIWYQQPQLWEPLPLAGVWHWQQCAPAVQMALLPQPSPEARERLAYFSPLPPQRSGVCDYSLALLPELAKYFEIHVIACDPSVVDTPPGATRLLDLAEFSHQHYHHILYHLGNSPGHLAMVKLLESYPGAVVLHDFYLSHGLCGWEADQELGNKAAHRLYDAHGYHAWLHWEWDQRLGTDAAVWAYPCNLKPLQRAAGVVVHSEEARRLAERFLGGDAAAAWAVIPHLKQPLTGLERDAKRAELGFNPDQFVICSFGFIGRSKLSTLLLEAFLSSSLAADPCCSFVLAGSIGGDRQLAAELQRLLRQARLSGGLRAEVRLTGWIDAVTYRGYQAAADAAVQLRTSSRGESSGTVLDCLAAGIPLIYNAHGSLAELPADCGLRLPDCLSLAELRQALEQLRADPALRQMLAQRGLALVAEQHRPDQCAQRYAEAIRRASGSFARRRAVAARICGALEVDLEPVSTEHQQQRLEAAAQDLALLLPAEPSLRQLFLDVSALVEQDLGSGVQRVVRSISLELLTRPPLGWRVEPVRARPDGLGYLYARGFTASLLGLEQQAPADDPLLPRQGDLFLGIDLHHDGVLRQQAYFQLLRAQGVAVHFVVHDLLPCQLPECFPPNAAELHRTWLQVVASCDGALAVSRSVAEELVAWVAAHVLAPAAESFQIGWFHHGCDFRPRLADPDLPGVGPVLNLPLGATLLMVGTVEPRKGYLDVVEAASVLWRRGVAFNLVIVGREGWLDLPEASRRNIPSTVAAIRQHFELGRRLFWMEQASDDELDRIYRQVDGLIGASYGEGFGIPLIEASSYGLPLLLRDLPVFHEVGGDGAMFFPVAADRAQLASAIAEFLNRLVDPASPLFLANTLKPQSWRQSAEQLLLALGLEPGPDIGLKPHSLAPVLQLAPDSEGRRRKLKRHLRRLAFRLLGLTRLKPPRSVLVTSPLPSAAAAWFHDLRASKQRVK